jgi:hypothetical protein
MKVFSNQSYLPTKAIQPLKSPIFEGQGKPIDLKYIYQKHRAVLPQRVLKEVNVILSGNPKELPSLMDIHKRLYAPLLECKTLEEAKTLFPEFIGVNDVKILYQKRSFKNNSPKYDIRNNFPLVALQEYWVKLRTQDEIAKDFGLGSRSTLQWALEKIGFVGFASKYKTILKASDVEGNDAIAAKTRAWNAMHPDLMYARNKQAAQANKKTERKAIQSQIVKDYDRKHPERREKISRFGKLTWEKCPEVAEAMSNFAKSGTGFLKSVIKKDVNGVYLSEKEQRLKKTFYKRFWETFPEMKEKYRAARRAASEELKASKKK